ncbi:polyprenyl synthetase family protein [Marinibacterium profundimaris]|uniref:Geranylgeranyl diphosphate synthase n=1 Tax=Marinibacterium profundimaris TaxID=1679460 RepID=A0A225NJ94_9RHOB|nr:polyprenyl synthetase family protein [Marinibacterium profundimaris]OWU73660.1 farnesyl-diphosphate synthase [Marinibacterium profundimaris]
MFAETLEADAVAIAAHLDGVLSEYDDLPVTRAMRWATDGGKRLRGFLVLEGARLHDVSRDRAIWPATAIEAMHAYSLVHDDLPAMDDDDLRRGQPTVHVKWDEATAILAGDALQALAYELVARPEVGGAEVRAELALTLARAAGAHGMVLGQALDIAAETAGTPLTLDEITALQAGKTGALFAWAAMAGPRLAGASAAPMRLYADALGLAFQIHDDILDLEGDVEKTGKRLHKDEAAGKATFVSLLGLDAARKRASSLVEDACDALAPYGVRADLLRDTARFVIAREC